MEEKKFECAYCGKEYSTINDRTNCELKCAKEIKAREELLRKKEYEDACKRSEADIKATLKLLNEQLERHNKSYPNLILRFPSIYGTRSFLDLVGDRHIAL